MHLSRSLFIFLRRLSPDSSSNSLSHPAVCCLRVFSSVFFCPPEIEPSSVSLGLVKTVGAVNRIRLSGHFNHKLPAANKACCCNYYTGSQSHLGPHCEVTPSHTLYDHAKCRESILVAHWCVNIHSIQYSIKHCNGKYYHIKPEADDATKFWFPTLHLDTLTGPRAMFWNEIKWKNILSIKN